MALIIDLKPTERIIVGGSLITNGGARTRLQIEGSAPILRERDIMKEDEANTPCKRIYLALQLMYLSPNPQELHKIYFELVRDVQTAAPSTSLILMKINDHILNDHYYKALKEARQLIEYEEELIAHA